MSIQQEQARLEAAIAALDAQRDALGDDVVDTLIVAARERLAALQTVCPAPSSRDQSLFIQKEHAIGEERKLVTVLFARISGLIAMAETLSPAAARELMNACLDQLVPAIERYGGTVDKFIGDKMMVVFGTPAAHENDPERALRAALDLQESLAAFNTERGTDLELHVGVETGLVIAGYIGPQGQQQVSVVGNSVRLSSRLEDAAQAGEIHVGPDTYRLTAPLFDLEILMPLRVPGQDEPVFVYRLLGPKAEPEPVRGIKGLSSPLVGRESELEQLRAALCALQEDRGGLVALLGEAGQGKSRLVAELRKPVDGVDLCAPLRWIEGRAQSYTTGMSYWIARDVLRGLAGVEENAPPAQVGATLQHSLDPLLGEQAAETYPYLARLLDLPLEAESERQLAFLPPETLQQRLVAAFRTYIRACSQQQPLVLVWEDLHCADPSSLRLLENIIPLCEEVPLLLLLVFRPDEERIRAFYRRIRSDHDETCQVIQLSPLSRDESGQLLSNLLRTEQLVEKNRDHILDKAGGNPFFMEELLRSLIDVDLLRLRGDRPISLGSIDEMDVPDTLQGVIVARIDRLSPEDKRILQTAAVLGRVFRKRVLQGMLGDIPPDALHASLNELGDRQFIRLRSPEQARDNTEQEYIFKNAVTQEVAYGALLPERCRELHNMAGRTIESLFPERRTELAATLAYHYTEAEEADEAVRYLIQAGDRARGLYAHQEAIDHYRRALAFMKDRGEHEWAARTLMKIGLTYHTAFDFQQARQSYEEGFALWQRAAEAEPGTPPAPAPHPLRIGWSDPPTLDPTMAWDVYSSGVIDQLFIGLLELSPELDVVPAAAQRWEVLEDGRKYIFHLRDGLYWSDGRPVTAGDFEYAWKRVLDPATGSPTASLLYDVKGAWAFHQGRLSNPEQVGVQAVGQNTLVVQLEEPSSYFPHLLTYYPTYAVPRHVVQEHGEKWTEPDHVVTNGPFLLVSWQQGESMVLERNPAYLGRCRGNVQRLELCLLADHTRQLALYEEDQLDCINLWVLPPEERDRARQRYAGEYISIPMLSTTFVGFDVSRPPFDDVRLRRALVLATNREEVADICLNGYEFPANGGFVPPGMPGHSAEAGLPYDLERARELLAEAGYPGGQGLPKIEALTSAGYAAQSAYLSAQWREKLGIEIAWEIMSWTRFLEQLYERPLHMFLVGWLAPYPDPDNFLRVSPAWTRTRWENESYAQLVEQARRFTDQGERMQLYARADRLLVEEAVILPLTYRRLHLLVKPWIKRYPTSAIKQWFWRDVVVSNKR